MKHWTLYPFLFMFLILLIIAVPALASSHPLPVPYAGDVHPLIVRAYQVLRLIEPILFAIIGLILLPAIIGRRAEVTAMSTHPPSLAAVRLASLWHLVVAVVLSSLLLWLLRPFGFGASGLRLQEALILLSDLKRLLAGLNDSIWLLLGGLLGACTLLFMPWYAGADLRHLQGSMLLPALLVIDGLILLGLNQLLTDSWLWVSFAALCSPPIMFWILLLTRLLRRQDGGAQPIALLSLLLFTLPVAAGVAAVLAVWLGLLPVAQTTPVIASAVNGVQAVLGPATLLPWLAVSNVGLALVHIGLIDRSQAFLAQLHGRYILYHPIHLPRRRYLGVEIEPFHSGWQLVDLPLAVLFKLAERLINAVFSIARFLDYTLTTLVEWLLRALHFMIVAVMNLIITLIMHVAHTLEQLPRLLREGVKYLLHAWDRLACSLLLPLLGTGTAAVGLAIITDGFATYFLSGSTDALMWGIMALAIFLFGMTLLLTATSGQGPGAVAYWYLSGLTAVIAYPVVVLCLALWMVIWLAPRFGIDHFHAGPVTWSLTLLIAVVVGIGLFVNKLRS